MPDVMPDGDPFGMPSNVYPAFTPPVPQITRQPTGAVLATPRVVEVYWADDAEAAMLHDFVGKLAVSSEWTAMVGEYGVGAITVATPVTLAANAPTTAVDADLQAILTANLDGTHPEWGPVDAQTLASTMFLFHTPPQTQLTFGSIHSCQQFNGYHSVMGLGASNVVYGVSDNCPAPSFLATRLDFETAALGHELVEATTDPVPTTGYDHIQTALFGWSWEGGSELGDLCEDFSTSWVKPADLGYTIQRTWSNASAAAYHNPCVPVPATEMPFLGAAPVQLDTVMFPIGNQSIAATGTLAHVGQPVTIAVALFSDAATGGAWQVGATDDLADQGQPAVLDLKLDRPYGENGQTLHLTITPKAVPPSGIAMFTMHSTIGPNRSVWKGAVGVSP